MLRDADNELFSRYCLFHYAQPSWLNDAFVCGANVPEKKMTLIQKIKGLIFFFFLQHIKILCEIFCTAENFECDVQRPNIQM